jgi:hypothetical protein
VTLDEAVKQLTDRGIVQPVLLRLQNRYFVKTDHTAIPIFSAACFADCVEFLFMCYYVFHSEYPHELRLIFGLIEKLLHIPTSIGKSSTLSSLLASL